MFHTYNNIHPTAVIYDNVVLGEGNIIGPGVVIGIPGAIRDDLNYTGRVEIGNNNFIGANAVIVAGYENPTIIGNNNLIMNLANIGHDVQIYDGCEIGVGVIICGYCTIYKCVQLKVGAIIRNRVQIAAYVKIGMGSVVTKDILEPAKTYFGVPAKCR